MFSHYLVALLSLTQEMNASRMNLAEVVEVLTNLLHLVVHIIQARPATKSVYVVDDCTWMFLEIQ